MSSQNDQIHTIQNRQCWTDEFGVDWTRKRNKDGSWREWESLQPEKELEPEVDPLYLYVVQQLQAPGEPLHWSLFVAHEQGNGTIYQVKGDNAFMQYGHASDVDLRNSKTFYNAYQICEVNDSGTEWLKYYANHVPPPQAPNRTSATENCQTWVVQVLRELQSVNVVDEITTNSMAAQIEPIN